MGSGNAQVRDFVPLMICAWLFPLGGHGSFGDFACTGPRLNAISTLLELCMHGRSRLEVRQPLESGNAQVRDLSCKESFLICAWPFPLGGHGAFSECRCTGTGPRLVNHRTPLFSHSRMQVDPSNEDARVRVILLVCNHTYGT